MRTIFLCGFMGCGKSTVGRELAKIISCRFFDMDIYITKKAKMPIPEIFSQFGESHFRELETKAISELAKKPAIIATGGGALISDQNAEIARKYGTVIFIDTHFETCYNRIKYDKNRPLASNSTKEELQALFDKRTAIYSIHSDITISGEDSPINIAIAAKNAILKL